MTGATGWEGLLDADEKILWQGAPDKAFAYSKTSLRRIPFFIIFTGFSIYWMAMAAQAGGYFWMFGLLFLGIGMFNLIGRHFWDTAIRRKTFYTLTNKRAFIAREVPIKGKTLKSYPITDQTVLEFIDEDPATIWFAKETKTGRKNRRSTVEIGFERLHNGREVYGYFRQIQQGIA